MRKAVVVLVLLALVVDPVLCVPRALPTQPSDSGAVPGTAKLARLLLLDSVATACSLSRNSLPLCSDSRGVEAALDAWHPAVDDALVLLLATKLWRTVHSPTLEHTAQCVLDSTALAAPANATASSPAVSLARAVAACVVARPGDASARGSKGDGSVALLQVSGPFQDEGEGEDEDEEDEPTQNLAKFGVDLKHAARVLAVLCSAFVVSGILLVIIARFQANWLLPPFGLDTSEQTHTNVVSKWIEMVSVIMSLVLAFWQKWDTISRRSAKLKLFHGPYQMQSPVDEGLDVMYTFEKQHSLSTFLDAEKDKTYYVDDEHDQSKPVSFTEWNDIAQFKLRPDPVRVLVRFYYVDADAKKFLADTGVHVHRTDPEKLLTEAYGWRKACWMVAHLEQKCALSPDAEERNQLKQQRAVAVQEANRRQHRLEKLLGPCWANLHRHVQSYDEGAATATWISETDSWASTMLAVSLIMSNLYSFLDRSPECPALLHHDLSVRNGLTRLSSDGLAMAPLPRLYNARTWTCSHLNTINSEEGSTCSLQCNAGFAPELGVTMCDSLGGGGMAWTHLESGLLADSQFDMPSCCVDSDEASTINGDFEATALGTDTLEFRWTTSVGFPHTCGIEQYVYAQACVFDPSDIAAHSTAESLCSKLCASLEDSTTGSCITKKKTNLVPVEDWTKLKGAPGDAIVRHYPDYSTLLKKGVGEHVAGSEIVNLVVAVPSGSSLLVRLALENLNGVAKGKWKALGA